MTARRGKQRSSYTDRQFREVFGATLRHLRERRDRKQYRVAEDAGVTKGMLSAYESGRALPRLEVLARVLGALNSSFAEFGHCLGFLEKRRC